MNELRVVSGFHRGVSLTLDEDPIVVGASLEADLVLSDPGIVAAHFKVEQLSQQPSEWQLVCLDGDVWDEDGNKISVVNISISKSFNLGGVWIHFSEEDAPWPSNEVVHYGLGNKSKEQEKDKNKSKEKNKISTSKILIFFAVAFVGFLTVTHAAVSDKKEAEIKVVKEAVNEIKKKEMEVKSKKETAKLALVFKKMLKQRGLQSIEMVMSGKNWDLEGSVDPKDIDMLKRMLIRFSKRYQNTLTINNNVVPNDYSLPFDIVKVISGPYGHVEANDGHKLYLGSKHKGMTLVSISKNELLFSGKNNITVNW